MFVRRLGLGVFVAVVALDQVTKFAALNTLSTGKRRPLIGNWISLQLIRNPGAAFSLGPSATIVFSLVAVCVLAALVYFVRKVYATGWMVAFAMLAGGALGNLIDRLIQPPGWGSGHVVDFINYNGIFVGNIADIAIVVSVIMILFFTFTGREPGKAKSESTDAS